MAVFNGLLEAGDVSPHAAYPRQRVVSVHVTDWMLYAPCVYTAHLFFKSSPEGLRERGRGGERNIHQLPSIPAPTRNIFLRIGWCFNPPSLLARAAFLLFWTDGCGIAHLVDVGHLPTRSLDALDAPRVFPAFRIITGNLLMSSAHVVLSVPM